jgi:hypothetical protein
MLRSFQLPSHGVSFNVSSNYLTWLDVDRNSETSVINLLDVQTSEPLATISSPGIVEILKLSALGRFVVTCRTEYSGTPDCIVVIDIWCTSTGKLLATVEDPFSNESLVRVDLSPLGNYLLLVSKTIRAVRVTRFGEIHYHGILRRDQADPKILDYKATSYTLFIVQSTRLITKSRFRTTYSWVLRVHKLMISTTLETQKSLAGDQPCSRKKCNFRKRWKFEDNLKSSVEGYTILLAFVCNVPRVYP